MSYTTEDAAWDEAYERMSDELYPGHKAQAIIDFTHERLRSYYVANPNLLVPAVFTFKEARELLSCEHPTAALVFSVSATELFLKGALLKPVIYGLVHSDSLAELVVSAALTQTGFRRYSQLLAKLFREITNTELESLTRGNSSKSLLAEAQELQETRNKIVHQGESVNIQKAELAIDVATGIFDKLLTPVLNELGFSVAKGGILVDDEI
ncbi:MAG: hypothetical protein ABI893_16440 [Polaromonas sp.]|uniref:hypothetical protein n=1 Tax=Polaromonas sp. TaxID=1869339 RepID=UPI0032669A21